MAVPLSEDAQERVGIAALFAGFAMAMEKYHPGFARTFFVEIQQAGLVLQQLHQQQGQPPATLHMLAVCQDLMNRIAPPN
jgi:hypothetical protein